MRPTAFLLAGLLCLVTCSSAHNRAAAAPSDTLSALIDRWISSAGGRERIAQRNAIHLRARETTGGVPGTSETWITRKGLRSVLTEGRDCSEWVRADTLAWIHDWNGHTRPLEGRDRADAVTDAFVRTLVDLGPSREALRAAGATDGGDDSTHTLRRVRIRPPGGVACELMLDRATGRLVRATRWRYADPVSSIFSDWRSVAGVSVPFQEVNVDREGNSDTTWVTEAKPLSAGTAPFGRPA